MTEVHDLAVTLAAAVTRVVRPLLGTPEARRPVGWAPGGDATLGIDEVAEEEVERVLAAAGDIAYYSEDRGFVVHGRPRAIFVIDPVDGTRPAAAGLEAACVSIGVVPPTEDARLGEVTFGVVQELRSGVTFTAARGGGVRVVTGAGAPIPVRPSGTTDLASMYWAGGLRGRPAIPVTIVLERLIDDTAMHGGYFDLGSAAFDLTRIVTGQLDAYIDVGRRIVDEVPATEPSFLRVGMGAVCTNFPHDVAAAALIVREAGGVVTHADGRPLDDHPAVGSGPAEGLAVIGAASSALHRAILDEVDRGMIRLGGTDLRD